MNLLTLCWDVLHCRMALISQRSSTCPIHPQLVNLIPPLNWLGLCNPPLSPLSVCVYCKRAVLLAFLCELCVRTSENGLSSGLPRSGPCVGLHYTSPPILCAHSQHLFSNQSWQSSDFWLEILALHPTGGGRDQSSLLPFKYCSFLSSSFSSSFLQICGHTEY